MRNLDYKSMLVGVLGIVCFLLLIGQRSDGNLGNITVESITVRGEEASYISFLNRYDEEVLYIGEATNYGGIVIIKNSEGNDLVKTGTADDGGSGIIVTMNNKGITNTYLGSTGDGDKGGGLLNIFDYYGNLDVQVTTFEGGGYLQTYNNDSNRNSYLGSLRNGGAGIFIDDENGNTIFEKYD